VASVRAGGANPGVALSTQVEPNNRITAWWQSDGRCRSHFRYRLTISDHAPLNPLWL